MSIIRNFTLGFCTWGGQAIVHDIRTSTRAFLQTLMVRLEIWIGGTIWYALEQANAYERFVTMKRIEAKP